VALLHSSAQSAEISCEVDFGLYSKYIWRGVVYTDHAVFQPSLTVSSMGLSANIWGNQDLDDVNETPGDYTEFDFNLDYTYEMKDAADETKLSLSVGVFQYTQPNAGANYHKDATTELYLGLAFAVPLSPTLTVYKDTDVTEGVYTTLGLGHEFELGDELSLSLGATVAHGDNLFVKGNFGDYYPKWKAGDEAATDIAVDASLSKQIAEGFCLNMSLSAVMVLEPIAELIDKAGDQPMNVVFGVSWTGEF
jgi:uncharacterized protein (TIGR02001 family)